jgi:tRNA (guanine37-N1)-methyltransferase
MDNIFLLCGHYEGVDQRVLDTIVDEEISIGDYVLTGGELPALVLIDTVSRLCEGVLASDECFQDESHFNGLLEYPQYTRPEVWQGAEVPPVLLTGHHKNIETWRREESLKITKERRPDMYNKYILNKE